LVGEEKIAVELDIDMDLVAERTFVLTMCTAARVPGCVDVISKLTS
jgi:hypothetical protein